MANDRDHKSGSRDDSRFASQGRYASSPCFASEIAPDYFDPLAVDPQQALDVARWRKAQRKRLLNARQALSVAQRQALADSLATALEPLILDWIDAAAARGLPGGMSGETSGELAKPGMVVAGYWPIKGELDLRPLLRRLHARGVSLALPLVETKAAPLIFRRWTPKTKMQKGDWNIPVPPPDAEPVQPDIALAPLVGWDSQGYRLGYGGGYFDRTLAQADPRPRTIGVGIEAAQLASIYPQPHDIPLDAIVTERGVVHLGH